jgi:DNA repair exonuclease SbcCD ATPase subunit
LKGEKLKKIEFIAILLLISAVVCISCDRDRKETQSKKAKVTSEDVKKEATEALDTTLAFTKQQKEYYVKRIETKITEYDEKLDELKKKAAMMTAEAQEELNEKIAKLQTQQKTVINQLEDMKSASGGAWHDLKDGLDSSIDEMDKSFKKALSRFK